MIGIKLNNRNTLIKKHSSNLVDLIYGRLSQKSNLFLKAYFTKARIKKILECEINDMIGLHRRINADLKKKFPKRDIQKSLKSIFNYKTFFKKGRNGYNAYDLCNSIGIQTCPYCNINLVTTIMKATPRKLTLRPPLDHFLCFNDFPLFGMSFLNLIPSCWTCNTGFKSDVPTDPADFLNPHMGGFHNDYIFDFANYNKIDDVLTSDNFDMVLIEKKADARIKGNIGLFQLETVYAEYKPVFRNTLVSAMRYPEAAIKGIVAAVGGTKSEPYNVIFNSCYELDDLHKFPFSKVNRDIVRNYASSEIRKHLKL